MKDDRLLLLLLETKQPAHLALGVNVDLRSKGTRFVGAVTSLAILGALQFVAPRGNALAGPMISSPAPTAAEFAARADADASTPVRRTVRRSCGRAASLVVSSALAAGAIACTGQGAPQTPPSIQTDSAAAGSASPIISFVDGTVPRGLTHQRTITWGSTWVDHDGDGDFDLLANRHWHRPRFFINRAGNYAVSNEMFFSGRKKFFDRHSCAWGEANGDGKVDLYCGSGALKGEGFGANQLWIQTKVGFTNKSREYRTRDGYGRSRSVNWIDYDSDGDLDLFVGNKLRTRAPNVMFRNDRGRFARADVGLSTRVNSLASMWSDWDGDGDPDLLLIRYQPEKARAFENVGGSFERIALEGVTGRHWSSASWGDYDGDGWPDLHLIAPHSSVILRNESGSFTEAHSVALQAGASSTWLDVDNDGDLDSFVVQGRRAGVNRSDFFLIQQNGGFTAFFDRSFRGPKTGSGETASVADVDLDGRQDLFVTNGALLGEETDIEGSWQLLENRTESANWVAIELHGDDWNPWGYGALLRVEADGMDYRREVNDGVAMRSQSGIGRMLLGIGGAPEARVTIEWPGGATDCVDVQAGDVVAVKEGGTPC